MMTGHSNCHDLLTSLSDYIDGELDAALCQELEQHLKDCKNCQIVVDTLKKTVELYQHEDENETLPEDVRTRLFYRLNLQDFLK